MLRKLLPMQRMERRNCQRKNSISLRRRSKKLMRKMLPRMVVLQIREELRKVVLLVKLKGLLPRLI